jgi:hypothetical protein
MLTAISSAAASISWSTGASGNEIPVSSNGIYGATASNPCGETTASTAVGSVAMGSFPPLIFPNSFTPNGDGSNDIFKIFQFGIAAGDRPAYNATGYRLSVFDGFGGEHVVAEHENEGCQSLYNGQIQWDGSISGNIVQEGVYTWLLTLKNCEHDWSSNLRKHTQTLVCTKYTWPWWCAWSCRRCVTWAWQDGEAALGAESVTVVR